MFGKRRQRPSELEVAITLGDLMADLDPGMLIHMGEAR